MYNFDLEINRNNTNCVKWDSKPGKLPMWVADMDFPVFDKIVEAVEKRASHPCYGYPTMPDAYFEAFIKWWDERHHFKMEKEWLLYSIGVVASISSIVRRVTHPNENVLIMQPVYNIFCNSISNNGRNILSSDLVYDRNDYYVDYEDLEKKLANPQTSLMILCNPHNPVGKLWSKEELIRIGALCKKHHVLVLSDEIHCDLVKPGLEYVPFASCNEDNLNNSITLIAPSKTFSIPGLQASCVVIKDSNLRHKINRGLNNDEVAEGNVFGAEATIAAYAYGSRWVDELNIYLEENKESFRNFIKEHLPNLKMTPCEATYLLWVDFSYYTDDTDVLQEFLLDKVDLFLSKGSVYGADGKKFLRINIATSKKNVLECLKRIEEGLKLWEAR